LNGLIKQVGEQVRKVCNVVVRQNGGIIARHDYTGRESCIRSARLEEDKDMLGILALTRKYFIDKL